MRLSVVPNHASLLSVQQITRPQTDGSNVRQDAESALLPIKIKGDEFHS